MLVNWMIDHLGFWHQDLQDREFIQTHQTNHFFSHFANSASKSVLWAKQISTNESAILHYLYIYNHLNNSTITHGDICRMICLLVASNYSATAHARYLHAI
jgi:hypothetical protein